LNFTGVDLAIHLWETKGMATYTPKVNDIVFVSSKGLIRYVVASINPAKKTADVKTVSGVIVLIGDVPWSELRQLDESQNALQIVREATENR
jgi:hypothetical protein